MLEYKGGSGVKLGDIAQSMISIHINLTLLVFTNHALGMSFPSFLVENYIKRHASEELKPLHRICLDRPGSVRKRRAISLYRIIALLILVQKLEVKKNLREFTGFTFEKDSEQYLRKKASLDK